ncbi:stage VI sporulation protein D [Alkalihalobacillus oceani]|uniref:stage VI sporulation protein D n=1 Tax=Halalkalibacter oceani TaxID=1653776 RepID=UPI00203CC07B|nr:stage VI sporulation protein D [Halalkalibacter oceani]MCM3759758.1 stage VI sporulation protein D [Halalkalibacter oceani]
MTQEHSSKLSFSIEESVWLNKGQEIEEILGMSLEPEIVIEERADHVYIRGGLRLIGEYEPAVKDEEINVERSLERQVSFRSAGEVVTNDNGKASIKHFFPIDVTIPVSRIHDLDDVYVQVESFDYDLPEKSCIQLTADISISGMTNLQDTRPPVEEPKPKVAEKAVPTAFAFEAKRQPVTPGSTAPEQRKEQPQVQPLAQKIGPSKPAVQKNTLVTPSVPQSPQPVPSAKAPVKPEVEEQQEEAVAQLSSSEEPEQLETKEPAVLKAAQASEEEVSPSEPQQTEPVVAGTEEESKEEEPALVRHEPETKITLAAQKTVEEEPVSEEEPPVDEEEAESEPPSPREENALYLTKMMAKKEERFIKLKMCIIQENESLETIADRYEVSTNQLVRINRLQNEQVEEGQILYIPVSSES